MENFYDIIIVGAGAAGMTAALYSLRAGKKVCLIECETIGGQISSSPRVENFPTIKEISGMELSDRLYNQVEELGVVFELDKINHIEKINDEYFELTGDYNTYHALSVILATGAKHRRINVMHEDELIGKGVSYCAVCDGSFYKNEDVCLIGDANSALQYAILLSNYCKKVYLCTLFDKFFGEKTLVDAIYKKENIIITHNLSLKEFLYDDALTGLVFEDTQTKELKKFDCKACFIAIGQVPNNSGFDNLVELDKGGYILTDENLETKTKGLYAVGDCRTKKVRQLTTAVSDGSIAAINACNFLK